MSGVLILGKLVRAMKADEETEVKALPKRVRELERVPADAHIDLKLESAYAELACEAAGVEDIEGFKKQDWHLVCIPKVNLYQDVTTTRCWLQTADHYLPTTARCPLSTDD